MRGGVVGHQGRGGPLGQRCLREDLVVADSLAYIEPEPLVLERVDKLVGERELEQGPAHAGVADHHQPLRAVVVEPEHLLLVDAGEHLREAVLRLQQAEQLRRLLVDQLVAPRVLVAAGALQQLDRLLAVEEQGPDRLREAQAPQPLDAVRDPLDVLARQMRRGCGIRIVQRANRSDRDDEQRREDDSQLVAPQRSALRTASRSSSALKAPSMRAATTPSASIVNSHGSESSAQARACERAPFERSLSS
jgi:hypothetical protein